MHVLITGHAGFVGQHLWRACSARGDRLVGVDTAVMASQDCRDFFRENTDRFDLVLHCAATVGGRETIDGDPLAVATNLAVDCDMFNWALRTDARRVVYFSSSAAYPTSVQSHRVSMKLTECFVDSSRMDAPDQTYGWAKLTGEMLAEHVNAAGVPVHVFRPFSGYGPGQSANYPFPAFVDRALRRDDPFVIWGDGAQKRDFVHIDDIVAAVFAAIEADVLGPVNVCTGVPTSFTELAGMVTAAAGYSPEFEYLRDKPVGVQYRVGDPTRLHEFYVPRVSLLEGVERALAVVRG